MKAAASGNFELAARVGYAARGVIYLIVGGLAALAATGQGGDTTDSRGALSQLLGAPFGKFLLAALALGLVCYAAWRSVQAIRDPDGHGTGIKGIVIRSSLAISALIYLGLAVFALSLLFGWGIGGSSGGSESSHQEWTAWLLQQPLGPWLVAGVGLAIIGAGLAHCVKAWTAGFERYFETDPTESEIVSPVSRFGLFARGVAFLIIGSFFVVAALQHDPSEARGLSGALKALQQQAFGWLPLAVLAFGLLAFGAYSLIESFYRRVVVDL